MIYEALSRVECIDVAEPGFIPPTVFARETPVVLRGLVRHWPAVEHGADDFDALRDYLSKFWNTRPVTAYVAPAEVQGRFGYNDAFNGFNFQAGSAPLAEMVERMKEQVASADGRSIYVGSTPVNEWLPGFREANPLSVPGDPLVNFWMGNRTTVSAHYDFPSNVACVVYGQRRFTLFPSGQVDNLYVGPIDRTPSGQPISLVDFDAPDFERFPRFKEALEHAQTAVLEPGDAIFVPSMWWHHVKALADCNLLVNYWWLDNAAFMGSPFTALMHAVMSIRNLSPSQRSAWGNLFNHYVFNADDTAIDHIPEHARGCLAELDENDVRRLRAELINRLNQ